MYSCTRYSNICAVNSSQKATTAPSAVSGMSTDRGQLDALNARQCRQQRQCQGSCDGALCEAAQKRLLL
jgi:hypothetical protein